MSDNTDLVVNALEYYDKNNEKYKDFFKSIKYIKFKVEENDLEHNKIIMYDKNKKEIFILHYKDYFLQCNLLFTLLLLICL